MGKRHGSVEQSQAGHLTVAEIIAEWTHRDRCRFMQMLTTVQPYAWPQMGNAQRFSQPH